MVNNELVYDWADLGKALHAPIHASLEKEPEEYMEDYGALQETVPDVVAVHGAPDEEEDLIRYNQAESHLLSTKRMHPDFDPLVLVPEDVQELVQSQGDEWLPDEGFEVQDYDTELVCTIDDYEGIEKVTSPGDRVDSSVSDYFAFRNRVWGKEFLDGEHNVFGAETDKDSLQMRLIEFGKTGAQYLPYKTAGIKLG